MNNLDLDKLCEECGELIQAASKLKIFYATPDQPWEKTEAELIQSLQDEIADVCAAISVVCTKRELSEKQASARSNDKSKRFREWGLYE